MEKDKKGCEKEITQKNSQEGETAVSDLDAVKKARDEVTKQLGDIVRQLAFAGIAVIWIIKSEPEKSGIKFEPALYWPLLWLILTLALDLSYYLWSSLVWDNIAWIWSTRKPPKKASDDMPGWFNAFNIPTRILLYAKTSCLVFAYFLLLMYIWERVPSAVDRTSKPTPELSVPK